MANAEASDVNWRLANFVAGRPPNAIAKDPLL
jgi:hypothetical protein